MTDRSRLDGARGEMMLQRPKDPKAQDKRLKRMDNWHTVHATSDCLRAGLLFAFESISFQPGAFIVNVNRTLLLSEEQAEPRPPSRPG